MSSSTHVPPVDSENAINASSDPLESNKVFTIFKYEDVPCEENLWWLFLLSCVAFPTTMLLCLGTWRCIRRLVQGRHPLGYQPVNMRVQPTLSRSMTTLLGGSTMLNADTFSINRDGSFISHPKISVIDPSGHLIMHEPVLEAPLPEMHWSTTIQKTASEIVSAQSVTGKIAVVIMFIVSMVSLALYFLEVTNSHSMVMIWEKCAPWTTRLDWQLEFVCSVYLLLDYFIRFVASSNKLRFMFEVFSLVDYFTIPPAFLVIFLNHHWTGLRFLRALYVISIPDILQYFSILRRSAHIRLAQLLCWLSGVIFVSAGLIHMVETYGDPHLEHTNAALRSYWEYVYFAVVSMSTVGYGDVVPVTRLGRFITVIFILFAFTVFAASVPELYRFLGSHKRYSTSYHISRGVRHVVVAGQMSVHSMENFLRVFFNTQGYTTDLQIVFVSRVDPDLEMEALLKRNTTRVFYIQGSLLQPDDLVKVKIKDCAACLLLADRNASNPTAEDSRNVMSVISVKNACAATRCLVQLLQSRSTTHVRNIPGFCETTGDSVICVSTLGLGLLAQSCLAAGASTMLCNLFNPACRTHDYENETIKDYTRGSQITLFMEHLSDYFDGKSFVDAAKTCYLKLNILLIGILEHDTERPSGTVLLNPTIVVRTGHVGIFLAKSAEEVSKAWYICSQCHSDVTNYHISHCGCESRQPTPAMIAARNPLERFRNFTTYGNFRCRSGTTLPKGWEKAMIRVMQSHPSTASLHKSSIVDNPFERIHHLEAIEEDAEHEFLGLTLTAKNHSEPALTSHTFSENTISAHKTTSSDESVLDVTKAFYSCSAKPYKSVMLSRSKAAKRGFTDHILVLVLAKPNDPPIGFQDFILPLRSTKIKHENLKEVVLLGDPDYLEKEWYKIRNLPKITLVKGDPLDRADLRAVSIKTCAMCVILPSRSGSSEDPVLDDKDAILASLNIMAMTFERSDARSRSASVVTPLPFIRKTIKEGFEVPMICILYRDINIPLLDTYDPEKLTNTEVLLMEPYVCGYALPLSALDSILIKSFFNPYALELIKALLFGDMSALTETFLTEGIGLISGEVPASEAGVTAGRAGNSQLRLINLMEPPLGYRIPGGWSYGSLFSEAIAHGMICLGLARRVFPDATGSRSTKRCVITSPPPTFQLRFDDLVYVLSS
ncbi:calcium-activated potassium channel slowpoke-like [Paramacrobiotus metropolitanus]|uniref:calcium-activated potassium channel slowpoke-like n=1 Tax=Paramacrobiotus metropolitanus TaxID=2943436 RepID=UPI0024462EAE|nr:calcium-activated potassium channel slowpoke-like [Paramacrobiotus metropolitanus]